MPTDDKRTNFAQKRFLPQQRLDDTFFAYLDGKLDDLTSRVWSNQRGIFGTATLAADGADRFRVATLPVACLDGDGKVLVLNTPQAESIAFENALGIVYYVGARFVSVPSGVVQNPRNDVVFYDTLEDEVGESAAPDSVVEAAGSLNVVVDSIFEAGVSHAGRLVTIYLVVPLSDVESVAIERDVVVTWDGSNNRISTGALLGQTGGSASTNVADYRVVAQGVTVRRNTDLSVTSPYAYIGTVTGAGAGNPPAAFSTVGQIDVSDGINPDLQEAYENGRTIAPAGAYGGAVKISSADSGDELRSILHLDRRGATEALPVGLANLMDADGAAALNLYPISNSTVLQTSEPADSDVTAGDLTFTRGGVNLVSGGVRREADLALLSGFATAAMNGLYRMTAAPTGAGASLEPVDGTAMGYWSSGESGQIEFLRLGLGVAKRDDAAGAAQFGIPLVVNGSNEVDKEAPLRVWPRAAAAAARFYEGRSATPRLQTEITRHGTIRSTTTGAPGTPANELILADRYDSSDRMGVGFLAQVGNAFSVPYLAIEPVGNGAQLLTVEAVTLAGAVVTFTRPGVDLLNGTPDVVDDACMLLQLTDAADDADLGLYVIDSKTATTVTARTTAGVAASFAGASGSARVVMVRMMVGNHDPIATGADELLGTILGTIDGSGTAAPVTVHPYHATSAELFRFLDRGNAGSRATSTRWGVVQNATDSLYYPKWRFGGEDSGNPIEQGVDLWGHAGPEADDLAVNLRAGPIRALSDETSFNRAMGFHNAYDVEVARFEQGGAFARVGRIFDDFFYVTGQAPDASVWAVTIIGSSSANWNALEDQGGAVRLAGAGVANDYARISKSGAMYMRHATDTDIRRILRFAGRIRFVESVAGQIQVLSTVKLTFSGGFEVGVRYSAVGVAGSVDFFSTGAGTTATSGKGTPPNESAEGGWMVFDMRLDLNSNAIEIHYQLWDGSSGSDALNFNTDASANWNGKATIVAECLTRDNNTSALDVDWIRLEDEVIRTGPKDRNS